MHALGPHIFSVGSLGGVRILFSFLIPKSVASGILALQKFRCTHSLQHQPPLSIIFERLCGCLGRVSVLENLGRLGEDDLLNGRELGRIERLPSFFGWRATLASNHY